MLMMMFMVMAKETKVQAKKVMRGLRYSCVGIRQVVKVKGAARLAVQQPGFSPAARLDVSAALPILFMS
ncbi:hypothetical protein Tco_1222706 [Tanacetum coccineum]